MMKQKRVHFRDRIEEKRVRHPDQDHQLTDHGSRPGSPLMETQACVHFAQDEAEQLALTQADQVERKEIIDVELSQLPEEAIEFNDSGQNSNCFESVNVATKNQNLASKRLFSKAILYS